MPTVLPEPLLFPVPGALPVVQPDTRLPDGRLYFINGWTSFGAAYGFHLTREQMAERCAKQAGPGELLEVDGIFYFKPA